MTHHRLQLGQHGLAIVALVCTTLLLHSLFDATGVSRFLVQPLDGGDGPAVQSTDRVWARVLLIHPELR